mmetsp:Transcript_32983/g.49827  ORF Transcript_32983/g.49827 Transcript_32983/m.49827 type:complete len:309 (-) Transcript_32983:210-1136(-)
MTSVTEVDQATVAVPEEKLKPDPVEETERPEGDVSKSLADSLEDSTGSGSEGREEAKGSLPSDEESDTPEESDVPKEGSDEGRDEATKSDEESIQIERVDSMHVDIDIPHSIESGEMISIEHKGEKKEIKVPKGTKGKSIRVRMTKSDRSDSSDLLEAFTEVLFPKQWESYGNEKIKFEGLPCTPIDDDHVDIDIPESAKAGDLISVKHAGVMKKVTVPPESMGKTITVRMTQDFLSSVLFPEDRTAPEPVKFHNVSYKKIDDDHVEIEVPESAESGDIVTVDVEGDVKKVKIPQGFEGNTFTVTMRV